ncbi:MAG TPA: polyphosphate kinase 1, partial [Candidatus Hydrogenedentes bacterium]|nr:polyphosphate kinase 1 [Candidatus Hydrogenedentota bacterium]
LYFGVKMWGETSRYAILEIPAQLPRFVQLPNGDIMYIDDVIRYMLNEVFYIFQYDEIGAYEFKISRDAELDIDNDFTEGYVRKMERVLRQRKGGRPVRFVYDESIPSGLRDILLKELKAGRDDTLIEGGRYHNMRDLMRFPSRRADLSFEKQEPAKHPILSENRAPMFEIMDQQDLLVTYPYQSFDHVVRVLREAAIDPRVTSIKMTLYRVARTSQIVNALVNAARNGKQVTVSIELLARFDEENNIRISERLLEVGATVLYGVPPMKVHSKLLLITREDKRYAGLSTGNFNETTGKLYVDSCLLTADKRLTSDVALVFEFLEQASKMRALTPPKFKHLLVSPYNTRKLLKKYIARETAKGRDGYIFIKVNHLTDDKVIESLTAAADAGVRMDLVVRTTYAMLPHKNIRAISILDRYLEHQRVFMFGSGSDRAVFMSSADLMERNLDWRVEVAFPVYDKKLKREVAEVMNLQLEDSCKARVLDAVQSNQYKSDGADGKRAQYATYDYYRTKWGQ